MDDFTIVLFIISIMFGYGFNMYMKHKEKELTVDIFKHISCEVRKIYEIESKRYTNNVNSLRTTD